MKELSSLFEVSLQCQEIANMSLVEIEAIPPEDVAYLYCSAEKFVLEEINQLAKEFGFPYPVLTEIQVFVRKERWYLAANCGRIIVPFQTIFETDYNELVSILIHELCHFEYTTHCKSFWELFEKCLKEKKLVPSDYIGYKYKKYLTVYVTPFRWRERQKQYKVVFKKNFLNYCSQFDYLTQPEFEKFQEYKRIQGRFLLESPQEYSGEIVYVIFCALIRIFHNKYIQFYLFDSGRFIKTDNKELLYLKDENQILCLRYDSRVKNDDVRIAYIVDRMKADNTCVFSSYNKCLIILEVDESHPLNIIELNKLKEIPMTKGMDLKIIYSITHRYRNLNKCEMIVVFSK
ncbi:MAG: M48 family metallopeptidase [Bacteroidales bacterium]|nr:M48 family metallopeptidase [Bacteroidales bacterium]